MFVILTFGMGSTTILQRLSFTHVSENLIFEVRKKLFDGIIYKDISWFDSKDRAPGVLTNVVSEDISLLNGLTTETIAIMIQGIAGIVIGIVLSFIFSWKMALITLGIAPFMGIGGFLRGKMIKKEHSTGDDATNHYKESNALLSDIIMNYRTVIGFGPNNIEFLTQKYDKFLEVPNKRGIKMAHIGGLASGYTNAIRYLF